MHRSKFLAPDSDVIIFGHTHNFAAVLKNGSLFINPSEICGRKFQNFTSATLEIKDDVKRAFKFTKTPEDTEFKKALVEIENFI